MKELTLKEWLELINNDRDELLKSIYRIESQIGGILVMTSILCWFTLNSLMDHINNLNIILLFISIIIIFVQIICVITYFTKLSSFFNLSNFFKVFLIVFLICSNS